jgi:hypothetical protein
MNPENQVHMVKEAVKSTFKNFVIWSNAAYYTKKHIWQGQT